MRRLLGYARIVCACCPLWVTPLVVAAQEDQRPPIARLDTAIMTRFLASPELLSPHAMVLPFQDDQGVRIIRRMRDAVAWSWDHMLIAALAIIGAVLLSLPLAYLYLRTKPAHEFDSSVLFSIVFVAATIAGIMLVVQGSVARALSVAGVVSAVRFRSSLKDSNDAVYLLGAIAVGLAAGSNELDVGVAISTLLSLTLFLLWKVT